MGPTTILDKSAFQSLGKEEHWCFHRHFLEGIPPILVHEILSDLDKKEWRDGRDPEQAVKTLAQKFGGSGGPTIEPYGKMLAGELLGLGRVPIGLGQLVLDGIQVGDAMFSDLTALNHVIIQLASGRADEKSKKVAAAFRAASQALSLDAMDDLVVRDHLIIAGPENKDEIGRAVDHALSTQEQDTWLCVAVNILRPPQQVADAIMNRWIDAGPITLKRFSPYAYHCVRVYLALWMATKKLEAFAFEPTMLLDAQYLYYLPFCQLFVSNDRIHKLLVPFFLRPNQCFVTGDQFKKGLQDVKKFHDGLTEQEEGWFRYAFGSYPPPGTLPWELWQKLMRPWAPRVSGDISSRLSEEEKMKATEYAQKLVDAAASRPVISSTGT